MSFHLSLKLSMTETKKKKKKKKIESNIEEQYLKDILKTRKITEILILLLL